MAALLVVSIAGVGCGGQSGGASDGGAGDAAPPTNPQDGPPAG